MRKLVLGLAVMMMVATGCKKSSDSQCSENTTVAPDAEGQRIVEYLTANNIEATKYKSNMYYQIVTPGSGGYPTPCSTVQVAYRGTLTSGKEFDKSDNLVYNLQSLIVGWIQGIPLIQKGGSIRLFIPPSLGYGPNDLKDNTGQVAIPGNSILIFDITLTNFQ